MGSNFSQAQKLVLSVIPDDVWLSKWLPEQMGETFAPMFSNPSAYHTQIIFTRINRNAEQVPGFTTHAFGINGHYHYPASTVKLPAAVLALEKINTLKIKGLTSNTPLQIEPLRMDEEAVLSDSSNLLTGHATIAHYIKKILLVSDNDAFNRLYEFIGQQPFNDRLHALGFADAQIIHRLSIALTEEENRGTNAMRFFDEMGKLLYEQASQYSLMTYAPRKDSVGLGFMTSGGNFGGAKLVTQPMDFSKKNRWPLAYHHQLVQWIMFPETQPENQRLNLTADDYNFLRRYMGMLPAESNNPTLDAKAYWPAYVKFLVLGSQRNATLPKGLRIFNKVGDAYGFLIDGAYIADQESGTEFLLSAVIYCNKDGILNDDTYDYDTVGFPFMQKIGEVILALEKQRPKTVTPDFSFINFNYAIQ